MPAACKIAGGFCGFGREIGRLQLLEKRRFVLLEDVLAGSVSEANECLCSEIRRKHYNTLERIDLFAVKSVIYAKTPRQTLECHGLGRWTE